MWTIVSKNFGLLWNVSAFLKREKKRENNVILSLLIKSLRHDHHSSIECIELSSIELSSLDNVKFI